MTKDLKDIILENEGLIYKAASYFKGYNIDDLYQAGCLGIISGAPNYDETKGAKFSTYIYSYIIGEMKKLVREDKPLKMSRDINKLKTKINEANDFLTQKLMHTPTTLELCEFLDISEYDLSLALNTANVTSIDSNYQDTNMLMHEIIEDKKANLDDLLYLKTEIENLEEPERTIMINRYFEDMTQSEVAKSIGLNQTEISRKESKVLAKFKRVHWHFKYFFL